MERKMDLMQRIAEKDLEYREMKSRFLISERKFEKTVMELTEEQQNVIWDFVFMSNDLDNKVLEIACSYVTLDEA